MPAQTEAQEQNVRIVECFFDQLGAGSRADLRAAYADFMAHDCVYENTGLPTVRGRDAVIRTYFDEGSSASLTGNESLGGIQRLDVEVRHIAAARDVVFTERVDHHYDAAGNDVLTTVVAGIMEFRDAKCVAWRDYFDPSPLGRHG